MKKCIGHVVPSSESSTIQKKGWGFENKMAAERNTCFLLVNGTTNSLLGYEYKTVQKEKEMFCCFFSFKVCFFCFVHLYFFVCFVSILTFLFVSFTHLFLLLLLVYSIQAVFLLRELFVYLKKRVHYWERGLWQKHQI